MIKSPQTIFRAVLYGAASVLLLLDIFFLIQSIIAGSFIPLLPIIAGVFITGGLLFIIYAESRAREEDKQEHRRLSRVAHQLESPLKTLEDNLAFLTSNAGQMPAEYKLKLKRMQTKTNILLENVRDVFLMLQAQSGTLPHELTTFDLCTVVEDVINRAKPLATARNVEIVRKAKCEHAPVAIDRHLFMIALSHIIENGILYTLTPGLVNITTATGKKYARVIIQDRGVGIKEEDSQAVFLPFARGHKAEQFDSDGIGVGLTLSRLIIQTLGGELIWKNRENSTGTEFQIKLPLVTKS
jgi:signal transduction histidine kinase